MVKSGFVACPFVTDFTDYDEGNNTVSLRVVDGFITTGNVNLKTKYFLWYRRITNPMYLCEELKKTNLNVCRKLSSPNYFVNR